MKVSSAILLIAGVALFAGCGSSIELNNDFDQQYDFSKITTFEWVAKNTDNAAAQNARQAQQNNSLLEGRIKNAVIEQLRLKGMTESANNPDVYVVYHVGAKDKVDIQSYGYGYSGYGRYGGVYGGPYGVGGGGISTYNYQEGTLIIDMYDATSKELVWRGTGTDVLAENPTAQQITENINKAVAAILSQYPPKK
jgi:hypothetical protein